MAKFGETIKNFLGFNTQAEDYDEYEDSDTTSSNYYGDEASVNTDSGYQKEEFSDEGRSRISTFDYGTSRGRKSASSSTSLFDSTIKNSEKDSNRQESNRMLGMNHSDNGLSVVLSRPTEYKDCTAICSKLRERTTVVVNFEQLKNKEDKKRILDFIYGCCYAIDGNAQRISEHVYILAPYNVDIYDDSQEEKTSEVEADKAFFF